MSKPERVRAPSATEIEQRFTSLPALAVRPLILGGIKGLSVLLRFNWTGEGVEQLKRLEPPLIFTSNHVSHIDSTAILGTMPAAIRRRTSVAAALDVFGPASNGKKRTLKALKRECLQILIAGGFLGFPFDRHGPPLRSVRTVVELSRRGWNVLLYPEGTRSRTGTMGPFKPGVGVIAKITGRPVIPIHVTGGDTIIARGKFFPRPGHATVRFGAPLLYEKGETPIQFVTRLRQAVGALDPSATAAPLAPVSVPADGATELAMSE